jgi:hypothetical protein
MELQELIMETKQFFNALYFAAVEDWTIENDPEYFEQVASCLSVKDKLELCKILDRNYVANDYVKVDGHSEYTL